MSDLGMGRQLISEFIAGNIDPICVLSSDKSIVALNQKFASLFSVDPETAHGASILALIPQLYTPAFGNSINQILEGTDAFISDNIFIPDGADKAYSLSFSPLKWSGEGKMVMISFRETRTGQFDKNGSRFRSLIVESPIAMAMYLPDGNLSYFNKAYGKVWGVGSSPSIGEFMLKNYNILQDEQLDSLGILPLVQKAFRGEAAAIPSIPYNPHKTSSIKGAGLNSERYIKGNIFPIKNIEGKVQEVALVILDITYQMQAEQILTDTHLKFQMLTLGLPGVIYEYETLRSGKSNFKYISQGCEEMFGISPEDAMKNADLLIGRIHPDDLHSFIKTSEESEKYQQTWQWEGRIVVNGKVRWIEGKSNPAEMTGGNTVRYGLLLDITAKKAVERKYELTEERLQLALQGAELGLWEWGIDKKKTIFNKSWVAKLGYTNEELEIKWSTLIHPEDVDEVNNKLESHLRGENEYFESEYRVKMKNGDYRWIRDKGRAVNHDKNGNVTKSAGTYLDINDKKLSEILIKRNEQLLNQLFENSPLGIVLLDVNYKVDRVNRYFVKMFGYTENEVIGRRLNSLIVPGHYMHEASSINEATASGKVEMLETQRMNKAGEMLETIIYGVPITFEYKTIGIYGIYVNITERKRAERELQVRNNELDNFVYKVSHDLRAPLSSILGLVNLANLEQNEDDIREYIKLIENRVKQLDHFINDVLSHSKNLKLAVTTDEIRFREIVNNCFDDLSYLPSFNTVKRSIKISNRPFFSDRWRINEIFRNLISNAIKYLDPEKNVPCIGIHIHVNAEFATIVIEDNGIGIEKENQGQVFEMFYRATEHSEGSGIGLYIVKNAIEKLNGHIEMKSTPQKGTRFTLTLPNLKEASIDE